MKQFIRQPYFILIIIGTLLNSNAKADVWDNPKVETYYSQNKEYKLVVTPQVIPDKYYEWYYYQNIHPQTKKILRKQEKFMQNISGQDTILNPCTAELFKINNVLAPQIAGHNLKNKLGLIKFGNYDKESKKVYT